MFTGLVEEVGQCVVLRRGPGGGARLEIRSAAITPQAAPGESIAVNGCCLTVAARVGDVAAFDLLGQTLDCTNLGELEPGSRINLERPLAANGRLGGHFVQGHIDGTICLLDAAGRGPDLRLDFELPASLARYVAAKGSVALNGVSLTVAEIQPGQFTVWIIPHTREVTNLGALAPGSKVNIETDILAKYAERLLAPGSGQGA